MKLKTVLIILLFFTGGAFAQEAADGETTLAIEDAANKKNTVAGDIDEEITNVRMRAESGSKSKWSLSSSLAYTGGAISRPFGTERPNLAAIPGVQTATSFDGSLSMRYRATKNDSFTLGTAFGVMTPLKGDVGKADNQVNIFNPAVGYSRVFATNSGLQNIFDITVDYGSSNESRSIDYISVRRWV